MSKLKKRVRAGRKPVTADAQQVAIIAHGIGVVGTTEHGEHVGMELLLEAGDRVSVLFPSPLFQKLMAALMAAGDSAQKKLIERLGSEQAAASHIGAQPFAPNDWAVGRAFTREGQEVILIRFKKDRLPVVDVAIDYSSATGLGQALLGEIAEGSPQKPSLQ